MAPVASAAADLSCDLVVAGGGRPSGSQPWLSPVLREQDDRGTETRLLWSWVSKEMREGWSLVGLGRRR
nr:hypothetical protein CFP56_07013 [Quercus suber]